jgi:hypothetical protein
VRNFIRKILREEYVDSTNPILGKMVVFSPSAKEEDIKMVLDFFRENGAPSPLEDRAWIDKDIEVVIEDYLKRGRDLGIVADYYDTDITQGINIYWGNPNDFINHDYTFIPYRDFISKFHNTPSTEDAFNKLYESEDELDWAKQSLQSEIKLKSIWKDLGVGDQITLSGDIRGDDGDILIVLNNEPFEVEKRYGDGFYFSWLNSVDKRPSGWEAINIGRGKDCIEVNPHKFPTDNDLIVNAFNKADYPF